MPTPDNNNNNNNNNNRPVTPQNQIVGQLLAPPPLRRQQRFWVPQPPQAGVAPANPRRRLFFDNIILINPVEQLNVPNNPYIPQHVPAYNHFLLQAQQLPPLLLHPPVPVAPLVLPLVNAGRLAAADVQAEVPEHLICPIALDIMDRPMRVPGTVGSFNEAHIRQWLARPGATNPLSREPMPVDLLVHDPARQAEIDAFMNQHAPVAAPPAAPVAQPLLRRSARIAKRNADAVDGNNPENGNKRHKRGSF